MKQTILITLFCASSAFAFSQQAEIDTLTERLVFACMLETYNSVQLEKNLENMRPDGSWDDIDYETVSLGFPAAAHLERLVAMAIAYRKPGSGYTDSDELQNKIITGIDFFYNKRPVSTNWWHQDIGSPQKYMVVLLLLKGKIDTEKLHSYASYLEDKTGNAAHKGKNRTWVSAITLYKGCIEDRYDLIETGFKSIASTIKIVDYHEIEGIKVDNSIHQHRPQLYSGGYGMSFMHDLAEYIYLAHGTSFSTLFTEDKIQIIRETLFGGQMMFGYRASFDFGANGRNISRENGITNISPETLELMKIIDETHAGLYDDWKKHLFDAPFPKPGNKYFWKSDIMTHHGANYYLSAKVISTRTNGTEMLNGENREGYYLPLGATNIMTNGTEYKNIFPVWDWTRVPGTTAVSTPDASKLSWYHFGSNKFAGGVSNEKSGCIAFEHIYHGVQARKAYFFMGDALLCLGTGITAYRTHNVVTTVNQCHAVGDIYIHADGNMRPLSGSSEKNKNVTWVYHDRVGYVFPEKGTVVVNQKEQKGSWSRLRDNGSKEEITHPVFSLWLDHGNEPQNEKYSYVVIPDRDLQDFINHAESHGFVVIKNEPDVQAVKNGNTYAAIFYEPSTVTLSDELTISSDKEAIILIHKNDHQYEISVSDPLYKASVLNLTINKKLSGDGIIHSKRQSVIRFELPQGEYTGSTVTKTGNIIR